MATETVIGNIADVQGTLILVRASGEQIEVAPDDNVLLGDMLYAVDGGEVKIRFVDGATSSTKGFGLVKTDNIILFDEAALLDIDQLLAQTDLENPVALDFQPSLDIINRFNELLPTSAGGNITTAEEQSRSQTVVDSDNFFSVARSALETLPNANPISSPTTNLSEATVLDQSLLVNSNTDDVAPIDAPVSIIDTEDNAVNNSSQTVARSVVAPTIVSTGDSGFADEDTTVTGTLVATDGDGLTQGSIFTIKTLPAWGTAIIDPIRGAWEYTPIADFNGIDAFTVTITDDNGNTTDHVVTATVAPVNDSTVINGDTSGTGAEDAGTLTGTLIATDVDGLVNGTLFSVSGVAGHGIAEIDPASGVWRYTPGVHFHGIDAFTVTITDDTGHATDQVIAVTVTQTDDPVTVGGSTSGTGAEDDGAIIGTLTATDIDGLNHGAVYSIGSGHGASHGTASIDPVTGLWSYTPDPHYNGSDTFTVTITDDDGNVANQFIHTTVTPVNDFTTIGGNLSGTGLEDGGAITGILTASDADGLSGGTVFSITSGAAHGAVSIDPATGLWRYTPTTHFYGSDAFTVTVTDDTGNATDQVVNTTVDAVNDQPLISLSPSVDMTALSSLTPTLESSVTATIPDLDAYSSNLPDIFYFDITVDTDAVGDQLIFESGGTSFGISIFQQNARLGVSIADGNTIDLITQDVLSNSTRYGVVVELATGNQLNMYLGELDGDGLPVTSVDLAASTVWSGSSDWTGTDDGGWGLLNGAQQGSAALSLTHFAGTWHAGRFYSEQTVPQADIVASADGFTLVYSENSGSKVISPKVSLADVDDGYLESATVSISGGFSSGEDVLDFTNTANITGSYNAVTGVLTLTGTDTLANYQAALGSVTYTNNSENPNTANRTVNWRVNDGTNDSVSVTSTIEVSSQNDAPTIEITTGIDLDAVNVLVPTESSAVVTAATTLDAYSSNVPDFFYFDVVVDTTAAGNQVIFESGGSGTGIVIFQNSTDLLVAIGNDNNIDLTASNVLTDNTRYGLVVELADSNQLTLYLGELDNSGVLIGSMDAIATTTWSGSSDWSGSDGSGWGTVSNSIQSSSAVSYTGFAGTWNAGRFYSNASPPKLSFAYTENDGAQVINTSITLSDVDDTQIESATVTISSGFVSAEDVLAFVDANGITGNYNSSTGVLTLTGSASIVDYQAALRSITYENTASPPANSERTLEWVVNDGSTNSRVATTTVSVRAFTQPPELNDAGGTLYYHEGDGAQVIDSSVSVSDLDNPTLESATVRISSGFVSAEDVLSFTALGNIIGSYHAETGVLMLSGTDTQANYEAVLESVTYENTNTTNPSVGDRIISWTLNDGNVDSTVVTSTVSVAAVNDAATLSLSTFIDVTALHAITPTRESTVVQQESSFNGFSSTAPDVFYFDVTVDTDAVGNQLIFESGGTGTGIAVFQQGNHVLISLGDGNDLDLEVRGIFSKNTRYGIVVELAEGNTLNLYAGELDGSGVPVTTISFMATTVWSGSNWSGSNSAGWGEPGGGSVQGSSVITPINFAGTWHSGKFYSGVVAPVTVNTNGDTLEYTDGSGPQVLNRSVSIADVDGTHIQSATISITDGFAGAEDVLAFTDTANITGNYHAATGILTLTGSDTFANYASALASVTYENTSNSPNTANRTVSWLVNDGGADSAIVTSTIAVTAVNDIPVLSLAAFDAAAVDMSAINALTPTEQSSVITTNSGLKAHAANAPDFFYFDVTVDTSSLANQLIYETGGTGTGLAFFQQGDDLVVSVGGGNDIDLTLSNVLIDNTRYGLVLELAAGNQLNVYAGQLDTSGSPLSVITLIGSASWSGSNWSGGNAGGWGTLSGSVQGQPSVTYQEFLGIWHGGQFYSEQLVPKGAGSSSGGTLFYTEGDRAQVIDNEVIINDDNTQLQSATIRITDGFVSSEDVLDFVDVNGITGSYNAGTGVLTLTGSASVSDYKAALESVTYENTSSTPDTGDRTVSWTISDGHTSSSAVTSAITLTSVETGDVLPNTLLGTEGRDNIFGLAGDDTLSGSNGQDMLYGGQGNDLLYGNRSGDGNDGQTDTFIWQQNDHGAGLNGIGVEQDTLFDFAISARATGGDVLELADLLSGENAANISNYLALSDDGNDTTVSIDVMGDGSGTDLVIVLDQVTGVTLNTLIDNGNIVFDGSELL